MTVSATEHLVGGGDRGGRPISGQSQGFASITVDADASMVDVYLDSPKGVAGGRVLRMTPEAARTLAADLLYAVQFAEAAQT